VIEVLRLPSVFGPMVLSANQHALTGLYFEGQKYFPDELVPLPDSPRHPVLALAAQQLQAFFQGTLATFRVPLQPEGTAFQQQVWQALKSVPAGSLSQYGLIAKAIGAPAASRAVGAAVGRNPISVIIPCHRIVGAAGSMTGYAGGLEKKRALLQFEAQHFGKAP
jgi:methylated-DNA-[protein]-cysteine S-methyltransferase